MPSILPSNSTALERAIEAIFKDSLPDTALIKSAWNIDSADSALLPILAWTLSVDNWDSNWSDAVKRQEIANSYELHSKKGTPWSVKRALELAGFGANTELVEGSTQNTYNGQLFADGSRLYRGAAWAEYAVKIDLGEDIGLDATTAGTARALLESTAPARCSLTEFAWKSDTFDTVTSEDRATINIDMAAHDITPWLTRYDGSISHNIGTGLTFNGVQKYSGEWLHKPSQLKTSTPLAQDDNPSTLQVSVTDQDTQRVTLYYDGTLSADGAYIEANGLVAEDSPMPLTVTKWHRHSGKHSFGDGAIFYDGRTRANGRNRYQITQFYNGNTVQHLTVN